MYSERIRWLLMAVWVSCAHLLHAQYRYNAWFRTTVVVPVHSAWKTGVEFQHRRQNGFDDHQPLRYNLMYTFRQWMHYRYNRDVRLSFSPVAYFHHYRVIQEQGGEHVTPSSEFRWSVAADFRHRFSDRFQLVNRPAVEYRLLSSSPSGILRARHRLGIEYQLLEKMKWLVYDELFLNIAGVAVTHFYDHNRTGVLMEYRFNTIAKLELGYLYTVRLPLRDEYRIREHSFFVHFTLSVPLDKH
ncbi:DUF2490 domain-containing protein [Fluviicola sp. SGL-29]|nr:DUF2490 domain-containing protein [Fluviicola sp. SGL-29]